MEFVEGETLAVTIARGPALPILAADLGAQIADALARAHIGHRSPRSEAVEHHGHAE
jgi:hypothetical protein